MAQCAVSVLLSHSEIQSWWCDIPSLMKAGDIMEFINSTQVCATQFFSWWDSNVAHYVMLWNPWIDVTSAYPEIHIQEGVCISINTAKRHSITRKQKSQPWKHRVDICEGRAGRWLLDSFLWLFFLVKKKKRVTFHSPINISQQHILADESYW